MVQIWRWLLWLCLARVCLPAVGIAGSGSTAELPISGQAAPSGLKLNFDSYWITDLARPAPGSNCLKDKRKAKPASCCLRVVCGGTSRWKPGRTVGGSRN